MDSVFGIHRIMVVFKFWIWFFRHSLNIGGFQGLGFGFSGIHRILVVLRVLDLVFQAFIEYWWFSGSWIWLIKWIGFSWISKDSENVLDIIPSLDLFTREQTCLKLIGWMKSFPCEKRMP